MLGRAALLVSIAQLAVLHAAPGIDYAIRADLSDLYSYKVAVDRQGSVVIAGNVHACTLPAVHALSTCGLLWVAKLDSTGQNIVFATYLGKDSSGPLTGLAAVATDRDGNIVLAGSAFQDSLPAVNAIQTARRGMGNLYIAKLAADGSHLIYATYLGGNGNDTAQYLTLDDQGAAYVAGYSSSTDFPTTPQSYSTATVGTTVIVKLSPDGQTLLYALSIPYEYIVHEMQVDASGTVTLVSIYGIVKIFPRGDFLERIDLPLWTRGAYPWVFPDANNGFILAGTVFNGTLPVSSDAFQSVSGPSPYVRIQDGTVVPGQVLAHVVSKLVVDPKEPTRIYAATDGGLFQSEDNGANWTQLRSAAVQSVAIDPFDSNILFLAEGQSFLRSTDRGKTWSPASGGVRVPSGIRSIAADPTVPGLIYAVDGSYYRSQDNGLTWEPLPQLGMNIRGFTPTSTVTTRVWDVRSDPTHPGRAFVLGLTGCIGFCPQFYTLYRTDDAGKTLTSASTGYSGLRSFDVDALTGDVYLLVEKKLIVFRRGNLDAPQTLSDLDAATVSTAGGHIYLSLLDGSIVRSDDGGVNWDTIAQLPYAVTSLAAGTDGVLHTGRSTNAEDGFLFRVGADSEVSYGTYFGGGSTHVAAAVGPLSPGGHIWLAGTTAAGLPVMDAVQSNPGGKVDGFVAEFDLQASLLRSTYVGGSDTEEVNAVLPVGDGSVILVGTTESPDFAGMQPSPLGSGKTFLARLWRRPM